MSEDLRYNFVFGGFVGSLLKDGLFRKGVESGVLSVLSGLDTFENAESKILNQLNVTAEYKQRLYSDKINGLGSPAGQLRWSQMASNQADEYAININKMSEYFGLPYDQMSLIGDFFGKSMETTRGAIGSALKCSDSECDSLYMFKKQSASSMLSKTLSKSNSLKNGVNMLFKFEYSAFYEDNYQALGGYEDLYWTDGQADLYYDIDVEHLRPQKTSSVLTHYANLSELRSACKAFWSDNLSGADRSLSYSEQSRKVRDKPFLQKNFASLVSVTASFKFANPRQAEVVCGYVEHIYESIVLESNGGSFELLRLSRLASEKMAVVLDNLEKLSDEITHASFVSFVYKVDPSIGCSVYLKTGSVISQDLIGKVCSGYTASESENVGQFLFDLYDNCENASPANPFALDALTLHKYCFQEVTVQRSFKSLVQSLFYELGRVYQFGSEAFSVTKLAVLQLTNSVMTSTANPYIDASKHPVGLTAHAWDPATFPRPFEMAFFVNKYSLSRDLLNSFTFTRLSSIFNKSSFFDPLVLYYTVAFARRNDFTYFQSFMGLEGSYFDSFWKYMVLFVRDFHMQGLFIGVAEADLADGLKTPFIRDVLERPILLGGDPSIQYPLFVGPRDAQYNFEKFTGNQDHSRLDNFFRINGSETITQEFPFYDGSSVSARTANPWARAVPVGGCDHFCPETEGATEDAAPSGEGSLSVYWPLLKRPVAFERVNSTNVGFMNCDKSHYRLKQAQYGPVFPEFYQQAVTGYLNVTSAFGQPILVSQNHLHGVDYLIASKFAYFDTDNVHVIAD